MIELRSAPVLSTTFLDFLQARHAEQIKATAIAAFTPSYYKPENEGMLTNSLNFFCQAIFNYQGFVIYLQRFCMKNKKDLQIMHLNIVFNHNSVVCCKNVHHFHK